MYLSEWRRLGAVAALIPFIALADHGDNKSNNGDDPGDRSFESTVVGSVPSVTIGGVMSGGAPWTVKRGEASVSLKGRVKVNVRGLLLTTGAPTNLVGTTGPVQMVAASLVCGGSGGAVAASTDGVALSSDGDAEIAADVTIPATCMAPVVLVRVFVSTAAPGSQLGPFIAVTGFNMPASSGHDDGSNQQ